MEVNATGATTLRASGSIDSLAALEARTPFSSKAAISRLYKLVGVVLPATRVIRCGKLSKEAESGVRQIDGKLGNSDDR
jgi:hypothetical protein